MPKKEKRTMHEANKNEFVRVATTEETENILFLTRKRVNPLIKEGETDLALKKIAEILEEKPDATVLVIDTDFSRIPVLRKGLEMLGIPTETREAVGKYGEHTDPFTIAVRRMTINLDNDNSQEKTDKKKVVTYKKE